MKAAGNKTGEIATRMVPLLATVLLATVLLAPALSLGQPTVAIGIGDDVEGLPKRVPVLSPYLAAIRKRDKEDESFWRKAQQDYERCKKQKRRDCEEIDSPMAYEPATVLTGSLSYRDGKTAFEVADMTALRLRQRGSGPKGEPLISEIAVDFGPVFRDVSDLVRRFGDLGARAEAAAAAISKSGLPRYQDQPHDVTLKTRIHSLEEIRRNLEETQMTEQLRRRCGGNYDYLLGAWADDRVFALLVLTGEQGGDVMGAEGKDLGWRLQVIVAQNSLLGGRFRPVESHVRSFHWAPPMEWAGFAPFAAKPGVYVIRAQEDWARLWKSLGQYAPCVGFKDTFVVAIFLGEKPTVGFHVEWTTPPAQAYDVVSFRVKENPAHGRGTFYPYAVRRFPHAGGEIRVRGPAIIKKKESE
jgi:hypothetical protein